MSEQSTDGWPGEYSRSKCPNGHAKDLQTPWGGSRAAWICTVCQSFWGPEGLGMPKE